MIHTVAFREIVERPVRRFAKIAPRPPRPPQTVHRAPPTWTHCFTGARRTLTGYFSVLTPRRSRECEVAGRSGRRRCGVNSQPEVPRREDERERNFTD
ncbi:hypothetical protein EVAR_64586_1 [Eumeta japonica]|uniref:Uncharacterized protein n=1 Tax=Eumeta variegata TaxID=151549 RepID=A0A4C1ZMI3_EUMVA|nr:hypothetical protein EVAR_64586_1 [Eumeta japonica]